MNAIGTQLRGPTNSGLTRWRLAVLNITMDAAAEIGRNPVCKHQIQSEYGDEQADAGRDCRTRLARPNSQARTRTGKYSVSLFSWPRAGLATLPGLSIFLLYVTTIHTYCCINRSRAMRILLIYSTKKVSNVLLSLTYNYGDWLQVQRYNICTVWYVCTFVLIDP